MMHPDTELRFVSPEVGQGVFAVRLIPRGTIVWAMDEFDQKLAPERVAEMRPACRDVLEKYAYVDAAGDYVFCWDIARYVNHSCDATDFGIGPDFEIAVRDIQPGEQLTTDYAVMNITESFACRCGSPKCRGAVRSDDLLRKWPEWDALVAAALPDVGKVPQALRPFLRDPAYLDDLLAGRAQVPSHLKFRCVEMAEAAEAAARESAALNGGNGLNGGADNEHGNGNSGTAGGRPWRLDTDARRRRRS